MAAGSPACATEAVELERITLDEGNVTAFLEATSQHYVDAMRALIDERYRDEYRAIRWEALEEAMRRAPVARLEYHFTLNGFPNVRVYHAMGGRSLSSVARSIFEGPTRPSTPDRTNSPTDSDSEAEFAPHPLPVAEEAAADLADSRFYAGFGEAGVRAPVMARGASVLDAFVVADKDRLFDPEFKALRSIEKDLQDQAIPSGGSIRGSVSELVCTSCEAAMKRFSGTYAVDIRLSHLYPSVRGAGLDNLVASGKARLRGDLLVDAITDRPLLASDLLDGAREGQIRRSLSPRAMGRSFKRMPWSRRSFRLNPVRLPRISEGSSEGSPPPRPRIPKERAGGC
ncbi:hypothetical protein BJI69_05085 [Luteibacter rhizovicinus DSM 16549]|uniref:Uncharacterized protein n=2 Tax=Luteibacter rhizovicinus TaxID=242606 RepID=A0A1L3EQJ4_9GAMM|nr:hypothetical protein BJI69_05085 [Luteibacter rhizovicinus DSM 16549]KLD79386.1 hypothetical protein Y886_04685 [Xanthomonas hyacinthi DSM 19077]